MDSVTNDNAFNSVANDASVAADPVTNNDDSSTALLSNTPAKTNESPAKLGSPFDDDDETDDVSAPSEPLLGTSTFKPSAKHDDKSKSTEIVWDDYDKDNNPFFES